MNIPIPAKVQIVVDSNDFPTIPGKSAYDVWLDIEGNEGKTESQFIESIRGPSGSGGGAVKQVLSTSFPAGQSQVGASSPVYTQVSGVLASITPSSSASKVRIEVQGSTGITANEVIVQLTLKRKIGSTVTDITPSGSTGLAATRGYVSGSMDYIFPFKIDFTDSPNTNQPVEYQLWWKNFGSSSVTATLGKRNSDSTMLNPTQIILSEIDNA